MRKSLLFLSLALILVFTTSVFADRSVNVTGVSGLAYGDPTLLQADQTHVIDFDFVLNDPGDDAYYWQGSNPFEFYGTMRNNG